MSSNRKISYKLPPTTIRDKLVSQEARRNKRRANKIDSARQLDLFAGLNLGTSDDEDSVLQEPKIEEKEEEEDEEQIRLVPASVAQYASMLQPGFHDEDSSPLAMTNTINTNSAHVPTISHPLVNVDSPIEIEDATKSTNKKKSRGGSANKQKRRAKKASKWADRCMYAELLEMSADDPWSCSPLNIQDESYAYRDGLPSDLESGWVAVAPVPVGKRCLAVTQQSAGVAGVVPNTTLRSRLLGKTLLPRFPSALPPLTVLDCILDDQWRENGILHVLDVVKWKGQDVAECEAGFRFWWRDTRLAELAQTSPPSSINFLVNQQASTSTYTEPFQKYHFPYPTTFVPVPYHANTTLSSLDNEIIPAARTWREVSVSVPMPISTNGYGLGEGGMDVEPSVSGMISLSHPQIPLQPQMTLTSTQTCVQPDGMLLYVAEASYEPGTSPLSSWIPIRGYDVNKSEGIHNDNRPEAQNVSANAMISSEGPLDLFQRLVRRRMAIRLSGGANAGPSNITGELVVNTQGAGGSRSSKTGNSGDVDMDV
ncbi:hypothetical protein CVT25_004722 [Psilocybe cyanescens]|uniref:Snurportin-1 n=1 Tax=Psilocybe cyanescens TaxID=93625 RepID=A0A409XRH0_PSICY|nr:hypothetical protein CVT25_004722 [Psilocybe cyanescens]